MTVADEVLTAARPGWRPAPQSATRRWLPFVAAMVFVLLSSGVLQQLLTPYIRRDDWPFLLPPDTPGAGDPLRKVEEEGRWLSYAWWLVVGQHGSPVSAMLMYAAGYTLFVAGLWRLFRVRGRMAGFLIAAALLASPLWVQQ